MSSEAARDAAQAQLDSLFLHELAGQIPLALVRVVGFTVRNPATSSDGLLILANALDEAAKGLDAPTITKAALRTLADRVAARAPARAEPPFTA